MSHVRQRAAPGLEARPGEMCRTWELSHVRQRAAGSRPGESCQTWEEVSHVRQRAAGRVSVKWGITRRDVSNARLCHVRHLPPHRPRLGVPVGLAGGIRM